MRHRGQLGAEATRRALKGRGTVKGDKAPPAPETMADAVTLSSWISRAVCTGEISPQVAREMSNAVREFRASFEKAALEREIGELRRKVAQLQAGGAR